MLSLKYGVEFTSIHDRIVDILPTVVQIWRDFGQDAVITSARDGKHMRRSKHYTGEAIDLRTFYFTPTERQDAHRALRLALGPDYDVVLETTHIHVEYDPE